MIMIRLPATMRTLSGGAAVVEVEGSTVREALISFASDQGFSIDHIMRDGELHRFIKLYLNGDDVRFLAGGLERHIEEGDVLAFIVGDEGG